MSSFNPLVQLKNKPSRSDFDLSHKNAFTAKAGELLPCFVQEVIPGDKFKIKPQWFTRTEPLNTAAFTRMREYVDYYFVPYRILWNKSDQFFNQLKDSQHAKSLTSPNNVIYDKHPYALFSDVVELLNERNNSYVQTIDDVDNGFTQDVGQDIFGFNRGFQGAKLLHYLNYSNPLKYFTSSADNVVRESQVFNPFPLLAYQCIYQYFERFDQWEDMRADFFNVDYLNTSDPYFNAMALVNSKDDMFDLRYANWKKDLFMSLLPNAQYGDEASAIVINDTTQLHGRLVQSSPASVSDINSTVQQVLKQNSLGIFYLSNNTGQDNALYGNLPILALRRAEALQRYKEIKQANKYDPRSQQEAMWNVNLSRDRANMPTRIASFVNDINIDAVVNTSITESTDNTRQAANIAGNGSGAGRGSFDFYSEEHGIILGIYKMCPELDYDLTGLSKTTTRCDISDYANPFFDKLGMETVDVSELINSSFLFGGTTSVWKYIGKLGYSSRYYDYKTAIDYVKGGFLNYSRDWVAPFNTTLLENYFSTHSIEDSLTFTRKVQLDYTFFKINPAVLNPIFVNQIDTEYLDGNDYSKEQFKINMFNECYVVRNLDKNGLPY